MIIDKISAKICLMCYSVLEDSAMEENNKKKIELWRILLFSVSVVTIVSMWIHKDIINVISSAGSENVGPLIATTVLVTLTKAALVVAALFLIKFIVIKIRNKRNKN